MKINGKPDGGGGGDAIWGGITGNINSQTDLMNKFSDYATQSWVSGQQFAQKSDSDLYPLYHKEDGYLKYHLIARANSNIYVPAGFAKGTYGQEHMYNINGDILGYDDDMSSGMIYKFNKNTFTFDEYAQAYEYPITGSSDLIMWSDTYGVVHYGVTYNIDFTENVGSIGSAYFYTWDAGYNVASYYKKYQSSHNIVKFNGSIYLIPGNQTFAFKLNESSQQFEQISFSGISTDKWYRYMCYYEGKVIYLNNHTTYELKETIENDSVTGVYFEQVTTPYFPISYYDVDDEAEVEIKLGKILNLNINGVATYATWGNGTSKAHIYKLTNGVWSPIEGYTLQTITGSSNAGTCVDDLAFGYGYSNNHSGEVLVWNFSSNTFESYGWDNSVDTRFADITSRVSALEQGYGDALSITNQILG